MSSARLFRRLTVDDAGSVSDAENSRQNLDRQASQQDRAGQPKHSQTQPRPASPRANEMNRHAQGPKHDDRRPQARLWPSPRKPLTPEPRHIAPHNHRGYYDGQSEAHGKEQDLSHVGIIALLSPPHSAWCVGRPSLSGARSALGLAEFVSGLASLADRDLAFQGRLKLCWLALCASSFCSRALRFAVSRDNESVRRDDSVESAQVRRLAQLVSEDCKAKRSATSCASAKRELDRLYPYLGESRSRSATEDRSGQNSARPSADRVSGHECRRAFGHSAEENKTYGVWKPLTNSKNALSSPPAGRSALRKAWPRPTLSSQWMAAVYFLSDSSAG
jgi:hypothetical protein